MVRIQSRARNQIKTRASSLLTGIDNKKHLGRHFIVMAAVSVKSSDNLQPMSSANPFAARSRHVVSFGRFIQLHGSIRRRSSVLSYLIEIDTVILCGEAPECKSPWLTNKLRGKSKQREGVRSLSQDQIE